ncbi:MAG TPA: ankyrin repeat domain-containing protein [Candidatus Babeliales bacterium]|nr:ankyrin repeat domain-containing protein [Candidatus Babeliales bacterium]
MNKLKIIFFFLTYLQNHVLLFSAQLPDVSSKQLKNINSNQNESLIYHVKCNNSDTVTYLLYTGSNVNEQDIDGNMALMYTKNIDMISLLIKNKININITNNAGETPLIYHLKKGSNENLIRSLLTKETNIAIQDKDGNTALMYTQDKEIFASLITRCHFNSSYENKQITLNKINNKQKTALMHYVKENNEEIVSLLLEHNADPTIQNSKGKTAVSYVKNPKIFLLFINSINNINTNDNKNKNSISYCIKNNTDKDILSLLLIYAHNESIILSLLTRGADINKTNNAGETPLMHHVHSNNEKIVTLLLNEKADVNMQDKYGNTALMYAQNESMISLLLNHGANINIRNNIQATPLILFVCYNNEKIVTLLLNEKAAINMQDKDGNTALMYAKNESMISLLLNHGADINIRNNMGTTPLLHHVNSNNEKIVTLLLNNENINVNIKDENHDTALMYAIKSEKEDIILLLLPKADLNIQDKNGNTALMLAANKKYYRDEDKQIEIIKLFLKYKADTTIKNNENETAYDIIQQSYNYSFGMDKETARKLLVDQPNKERARKLLVDQSNDNKIIIPYILKYTGSIISFIIAYLALKYC